MHAYLDYNATNPVDPAVAEAMAPSLHGAFGNASSFHQDGQLARKAVETARDGLADVLRCESGDLVFTSGGTEADNLAVIGVMAAQNGSKRTRLIVSAVEHQAVLESARYLGRHNFDVLIAPVGPGGVVDVDFIEDAADSKTALISLMQVNNEVGTIQPVEAVARIAKACGAYFHCDAVQSFGKLGIHPLETGIDLLSISSHKICGPKGAGALYIRKGLRLKPLFHGGHQEKDIRPGTENVPAIVGFGMAARLAQRVQREEKARVGRLRDKLERALLNSIAGMAVNGDPKNRIYNTLNVSFEGLDGETLLINMDLMGISVSAGSACTAGSMDPSHVLLAMGVKEGLARAAVRFSLGRFTADAEIDFAVGATVRIVKKLRKSSTGKK